MADRSFPASPRRTRFWGVLWSFLFRAVAGAALGLLGGCGNGHLSPWEDPCSGRCASEEICWAGACLPKVSCPEGLSLCPYSNGAMGCTDLRKDPFNCGSCGLRCTEGTCILGVCLSATPCETYGRAACADPSGVAYCANLGRDLADCGECGVVCNIAEGETCASGTCMPKGTACEDLGLAVCPTGCVDLTRDPDNCGQCGNECIFGCDGSGRCR